MHVPNSYTRQHCAETGFGCCLKEKVVILNNALDGSEAEQLYFCLCGNGAGSNPKGTALFLVSLHTGQFRLKSRKKVLGTLKAEFLPDSAREKLAQVRPVGARNVKRYSPKYNSCCYRKDGSPFQGAMLCTESEVMDYVQMQALYQHRIEIFNQDGSCVLKMQEGAFFPSQHAVRKGADPKCLNQYC